MSEENYKFWGKHKKECEEVKKCIEGWLKWELN